MDLEKGEKHVVNFDNDATTEGGAETTDDKEARRRAFANKRDNKKSTIVINVVCSFAKNVKPKKMSTALLFCWYYFINQC